MENHKQHNLKSKHDTAKEEENRENIQRINKNLSIKDFYIFNDKEFINNKGQRINNFNFNTLILGSVYSVATQDFLIGITNLSYAPSIGLPRPKLVGSGKTYIIKDEAGGAGTTTITIRSAGEETIDGASTSTITSNYGSREVYTDGANWFTK